jgi:hypothetical protein
MNRDESIELLQEFVGALTVLWHGAGLLAAVALGGGAWTSGGATNRLRDDLLSNLDRFDAALAQLGNRLHPPITADASEAMRAFRAVLEPWQPPEMSPELGRAATRLASSLAKTMFAPAATSPAEDPPILGVDKLGLPLPRAGLRTFYNAAARVLLVSVEPAPTSGKLAGFRLFMRRTEEATYREIVLPGERLIVEDVSVSATAPFAYVHAMRLAEDGSGANDGGLFRIALTDGTVHPIQTRDSGGWVSSLLGASADGRTVYVIATGAMTASPNSCRIGYGLASVDVDTGETIELAPLPGIFA